MDEKVENRRGGEVSPYVIDFQCITKMFCSFITNTVVLKIQCDECLEEKASRIDIEDLRRYLTRFVRSAYMICSKRMCRYGC